MKWWMLATALWTVLQVNGQAKKWDGEGGDQKWENTRNWTPDGIPLATDSIIFDHSYLQGSYCVKLPDGNSSVEVASITIEGKSDTIKLIIPETNIASPALIISNPSISICIKKAGVLINQSGASAGNTFQLTGSLMIENGGTYLHQTLRGSAAIVAKLLMDMHCTYGNFNIDVPGTAGYILSLSGRTYGTLILSAEKSGGKRTYTGSGNNTLDIQGDLVVSKGATLSTTLNGNILIHGSLRNEGSIICNPTSADTSGRSIIFSGKTSSIINHGSLSGNASLKRIAVDSNASLQLQSDLITTMNTLQLDLHGTLRCDSFHIAGTGEFISHTGSWISSSSPTIISTLPNEGNIRYPLININIQTGFICIGEKVQHSGNAFPDSISAIVLEKPNSRFILDKPLHVRESIVLKTGLLKTDSVNLLSFSGNRLLAKNPFLLNNNAHEGYISGTLQYDAGTNDSIMLPMGNDTVFEACIIKGCQNKTYRISFDAENHIPEKPAIYNNIGTSHWHFNLVSSEASNLVQETISVYIENAVLSKREQPVILFSNASDTVWKRIPTASYSKSDNSIITLPLNIQNGIYTIASIFSEALPLEKIILNKRKQNDRTALIWKTILEDGPVHFIVEQSINGFTFQPIINNKIVFHEEEYSMELLHPFAHGFFRITAKVGERIVTSNVIYVEAEGELKLFPNPASNQVSIMLKTRSPLDYFELIDVLGRKSKPNVTWDMNVATIPVDSLSEGLYYLILHQGKTVKSWRFLKK